MLDSMARCRLPGRSAKDRPLYPADPICRPPLAFRPAREQADSNAAARPPSRDACQYGQTTPTDHAASGPSRKPGLLRFSRYEICTSGWDHLFRASWQRISMPRNQKHDPATRNELHEYDKRSLAIMRPVICLIRLRLVLELRETGQETCRLRRP